MKKTLVSALTTALVVGAASTTFAAANPFSDVPAGHWSYDAITQLAADGVIEGYGDGTFRGDRQITRYEMAQMIAKAMAKNPGGVDKALLDKLAAEFSDELNNLGVRVANLEKHADKVKWTGKVEYTYHNTRYEGERRSSSNGYVFRLEPKAEVNDHWTVNARLDSSGYMDTNRTTETKLKRAWAQGDYGKYSIKLGKFEFCPGNEKGILWDTEMSGVTVGYNSDFKVNLYAGRVQYADTKALDAVAGTQYDHSVNSNVWNAGNDTFRDSTATVYGLNIAYDTGKRGLYGGLGWYGAKGVYGISASERKLGDWRDSANFWTVNAGYRFSPKASLWANYARNTKSDIQKNSWQAIFDYGDYSNASKKGQWGAYIGFRKFGTYTSLMGTVADDALIGTKGLVVGAQYAPFKNVGILLKYFNGKTIDKTDGRDKVKHFFARVELFF